MLLPTLNGIFSSTHSDVSGNKPFKPLRTLECDIIVRIELGTNTKIAQTSAVESRNLMWLAVELSLICRTHMDGLRCVPSKDLPS